MTTIEAPRDYAWPDLEEADEPVHIANPVAVSLTSLCGESLEGDILVDTPDEDDICPVCLRVVRHMGWTI